MDRKIGTYEPVVFTDNHMLNMGSRPKWNGLLIRTRAEKNSCIYENKDIMVMHNFVTYTSGGKDAVMAVFIKKDGLIWKAETGATPIK